MNVLFLSIGKLETIYQRGIYTDLLRCFVENGHHVFAVSANEDQNADRFILKKETGADLLLVRTGNVQKTGVVRKGINTLLIGYKFWRGINFYFRDYFDLILYVTPPVTFSNVVEKVKRRNNAFAYLMLKDIFPQNAVDIGMMGKSGWKGLLYKYFRKQEKKLYAISDRIGCMSPANVEYILRHNPEIDRDKVEVCPNSIEVVDKSVDEELRVKIREKYGIPLGKKVLVYGGNLGKPQGVPFIIECLKKCEDMEDIFFLIVGDGTDYRLLEEYVRKSVQSNLKVMKRLPKEDYDTMVGACDVGLIFLDHRFTIPNYPSRLLSYMQAKLPILACTDPNTDIGRVIVDNGFGWWCESDDPKKFRQYVNAVEEAELYKYGENAYRFLRDNYNNYKVFQIIVKGDQH